MLVVTNTQWDLEAYVTPPGDFETLFGFDAAYFAAVAAALDDLGARNWRMLFVGRDIARVARLRAEVADPRLHCRFGGVLKLRANSLLAVSTLIAPSRDAARLALICGDCEGGVSIEMSGPDAALAWQADPAGAKAPLAECSLLPDGYLVVFPGSNNVFGAFFEGGALHVSNGVRWRRLG